MFFGFFPGEAPFFQRTGRLFPVPGERFPLTPVFSFAKLIRERSVMGWEEKRGACFGVW